MVPKKFKILTMVTYYKQHGGVIATDNFTPMSHGLQDDVGACLSPAGLHIEIAILVGPIHFGAIEDACPGDLATHAQI